MPGSQPPREQWDNLSIFMDVGNELLQPSPAAISTGIITTTQGRRGALTIRTASATMTVFLLPQDCDSWSEIIAALGREVAKPATPKIIPATAQETAAIITTNQGRNGKRR